MPEEKRFEDKLAELLHLRSRQKQQQDRNALAIPPAPPQTEPMLVPDAGDDDNDLYDRRQPEHVGGAGDEPQGQFPIKHNQSEVVDPALMQQPSYDDNNIQILNDTAADESLPVLNYYISQLSHLGDKAQGRLIARAASFQSKNQVFSNIVDTRDYQMAQDDFQYAQILSKADFTAFDMNTDYFTAEAIMEAQFNIRLRRSRKALNLSMFNTQRQESIMAGGQHHEESQKIWQKVPFLGGGGGGGGGRY